MVEYGQRQVRILRGRGSWCWGTLEGVPGCNIMLYLYVKLYVIQNVYLRMLYSVLINYPAES